MLASAYALTAWGRGYPLKDCALLFVGICHIDLWAREMGGACGLGMQERDGSA
jgi:hypothetical protein